MPSDQFPQAPRFRLTGFLHDFVLCPGSLFPPSPSTINFLSRHTKSTIYGPKGCCRRNLCPSTWRRRRCFHNTFSASVGLFLNFLACPRFIPPTFILPLKGGGKTSLALARLS